MATIESQSPADAQPSFDDRPPLNYRRILFIVSLATGLSLLGDTAMYTVLPTHFSDIGVALGSVGILLSANRFVRLFLNAPVGVLADKWPRRRVFIPATFLGAISTAFYVVAPGFSLLLVGRLLWGIAWVGIWIGGNAIVLDATGERNRGRGVGIYQLSFFLGAASGAILGGLLTDWLGYRQAMALAAGLTLLGAILALFFLPETGHKYSTLSVLEKERIEIDNRPDWPQLASATSVFSVNRLVVPGIFVATFGFFLAQRLGDAIEISEWTVGVASLTGIGLGATTLIAMIAAPFAGTLSDKVRSRWSITAGGFLSGSAGFVLLSLGYPITVLFGLPLISIASGFNQSLSTTLVGDLSPPRLHGRRLGVMFTAGDLASAIGPPIAYGLLPIIGLSALYRISAALFCIMFVMAILWVLIGQKKDAIPHLTSS